MNAERPKGIDRRAALKWGAATLVSGGATFWGWKPQEGPLAEELRRLRKKSADLVEGLSNRGLLVQGVLGGETRRLPNDPQQIALDNTRIAIDQTVRKIVEQEGPVVSGLKPWTALLGTLLTLSFLRRTLGSLVEAKPTTPSTNPQKV